MNNTPVLPGWKTEQKRYEDKTGATYIIRRGQDDKKEIACLKVLSIDGVRYKEDSKNKEFLNEIASACMDNRQLDSANIVRYEDIRYVQSENGKDNDIYIKTEFLTQVSKKAMEGASEDQVIKLARDICSALDTCEKHGLVHGNIDLNNIYISGTGTYKLGNIGIESVFLKREKIKKSGFPAPETANGKYDNRSDIYSLGCVMRRLLAVGKIRNYNSDNPKPMPLNDRLQAIIAKACAEEPGRRYQTAREMLNDLEALCGVKKKTPVSFRWLFKTLVILISISLAVFVLAGLVLLFNSRRSSSSDHEHDYSYANSDSNKHWVECACGEIKDEVTHKYVWYKDYGEHWEECTCGRVKEYGAHDFDEAVITKQATEEAAGVQQKACKICKYSVSEAIPRLEHVHNYSDEWERNDLDHWKKCACGYIADMSVHSYGDWTVTQEATIFVTGMRETACDQCGHLITEVIPKIEHTHNYTTSWISDSTSHWYQCSCGDKKSLGTHTYGSWTVKKEATIKESGLKERICSKCRYVDSEIIPNIPHTHSYTSLWISNGTSHWHQCSCEQKADVANHTYGSWVIVKEATATTAGQRRRTCTVCGHWQTEVIPTN